MSISLSSHRLVSKILGAISNPVGFLKDQLELHSVELCLVCEVCWRPQREGAYDVTTQSDLCAKVRTLAHTLLQVCAHCGTLLSSLHDACGTVGDASCEGDALHDQGGEWAGRHRTVLLPRCYNELQKRGDMCAG